MDYQVIMYDLPTSIKALTTNNPDGSNTIFINAKLNYEQQQKSFEHELDHINNHDFDKMINVDEIEYNAHVH